MWKCRLTIGLMAWPFLTALLITVALRAGVFHDASPRSVSLCAAAGALGALAVGRLFCRGGG